MLSMRSIEDDASGGTAVVSGISVKLVISLRV
jgi:hypothetical protein